MLGDEIIASTDPQAEVETSTVTANPTVSIGPGGKFVVVWNATNTRGTISVGDDFVEQRAQYFDANGQKRGGEFGVTGVESQIGLSAQHTAVYGPAGQVVVAYTRGRLADDGAYFTLLPVAYDQNPPKGCLPGDVNSDGIVNGLDIQPWVDHYLARDDGELDCGGLTSEECGRVLCAMDFDTNGLIDPDGPPNDFDRRAFIALLLLWPYHEHDCNANCRYDYHDVVVGGFTDCNGDYIPDTCQVDCECGVDPYCLDCNTNSVVDACEEGGPEGGIVDCNTNDIDDASDIAEETSEDCDSDGRPDECAWMDCNSNDVHDGCEIIDDPSIDCNTNGLIDSCDLAIQLSDDCNTNDIPDECDIAEETSADCNTNFVPDECDIADETSEDADTNGIPDECEQEQMMMFGGGEFDEQAAWEAFYAWFVEQDFSAMPHWQMHNAIRRKLRELGLE